MSGGRPSALPPPDASAPRAPARRPSPRRRYKFYRQHKVHYYLVLLSVSFAVVVCILNTAAYVSRSMDLAMVAFGAIAVAALTISLAFFLGFVMVMGGNVPVHRLRYLVPHAAVGTLSPLFYTLNIAAALDGIGTEPVGLVSVVVSYFCLGLLCVQFAMGKAVVKPEPLRLLRGFGATDGSG